jgi:hypothetical protein
MLLSLLPRIPSGSWAAPEPGNLIIPKYFPFHQTTPRCRWSIGPIPGANDRAFLIGVNFFTFVEAQGDRHRLA